MKKEKVSALIQIITPLTLLLIFTLIICFPEAVPFSQTKPKNSKGLGTVVYAIPGLDDAKKNFAMKKVPAGVAPLGCSDIPDALIVAKPFLLAETEVTNLLWRPTFEKAVQAGYRFHEGAGVHRIGVPLRDLQPVTSVSWRDAVVWCNALSDQLGFKPVYYADSAFGAAIRSVFVLADSADTVFVDPEADGFRLPGTAEWELAARYVDGTEWTSGGNPSGSKYRYFEQSRASDFAVFNADSPARVKTCASNALGIYDMSGNVWEWCFEPCNPETTVPAVFDTAQTAQTASAALKRSVRGGSWVSNAYRLQIGGEFGTLSDALEVGQGFRLAQNDR